MSYIPDCRTDESYNQKYLNDKDKEFVAGFDWCAEMVADNFFDNLDVYFPDTDHMMALLNEKLPDSARDKYEMEFTFGDRKPEPRKVETFGDLLREKLLDWIERERDELITGMIDAMDEDEYTKIKAAVDGTEGQSKAEN